MKQPSGTSWYSKFTNICQARNAKVKIQYFSSRDEMIEILVPLRPKLEKMYGMGTMSQEARDLAFNALLEFTFEFGWCKSHFGNVLAVVKQNRVRVEDWNWYIWQQWRKRFKMPSVNRSGNYTNIDEMQDLATWVIYKNIPHYFQTDQMKEAVLKSRQKA
jgi:hypothetical protein